MNLFELFLIAIGLSMDAFAVSVCTGLTMMKVQLKKMIKVGLYFGLFQAGMPVMGYLLGRGFADSITAFDHWIAFILLGFIGAKMIKDSFSKNDLKSCEETSIDLKTMLPLALATSIDALAVGVTFAFLEVNIAPAAMFVGGVTFILSVIGVKIGNIFGLKYKSKAEITGGIILIIMGIKILLEHVGI